MDDTSTGTFDMQSWQGLTKVLQAGRDANMSPETYAEFRDSVLRYAQSGGTDETLRTRIEELLPGFEDIVPGQKEEVASKEGVQKQVAPPENLPMGGDVPAVKEVSQSEPEPPKPPVEEKKLESIPEAKETPAPPKPVPAGELMSAEEAKERIAEIKHAVTEYVGNPVTLVSEDETIGRAYMKALLAALKAVSGNAPGTLRTSMHELEEAYKQVLKIQVGKPKAQPIVQEEKKLEPLKPPVEEKKLESIPEAKETPKPEKSIPVVERETTISSLDERIQRAKEKASEIVSSEPLPAPKEEKKLEPPKPPEQKETSNKEQAVPVVKKIYTEQEVEKDIEKALEKIEPEKPFATPDLPGAEAVPKGVTDDLYGPDIEEGIEQLLKEWRIFRGEKKIFGRGPNGKEHPLFQKLQNTIMFDVISGHFEGADKDVVLSIRDYANAWRNEQGIVYSPSETFEHYLRRVIRRIIKRST